MKAVLFLALLVFGLNGFSSETVEGAKKDYESFKQEMNVKLEKTQNRIEELKAKAKEKGSTAQDKTIQEYEETRAKLKAKIEEMEADTSKGWKKFKKGLSSSIDKLNSKIQKSLNE